MSAPSERDRKMAIEVTYAYEHGKPERPSLEHHIAEALAQARAEGYRAGIEAAARECDAIKDRHQEWASDERNESAELDYAAGEGAKKCAAAIRALAEKQP